MKKITLFILSFAFALSALALLPHKHRKQQSSSEIISVSMRRTGCYGRCPDYTIKIDKEGIVTYTGNRFVTDSGIFRKNIGSTKAMEIIDQFYTYQVDTCNDEYYNKISDLPGLILTVQYITHTKRILNAHYGPRFLAVLANTIEVAGKKTDDIGWEKIVAPVTK